MSKFKNPAELKILRVWNHAGQRMTPLGRIECAYSGCVECHKTVLESFKIEYEVMEALPDYQPHEDFQAVSDYVAYRQAHPLKTGRPKQTDNEMLKELKIGRYAEVIYRKGKAKRISLEQAIQITADKFFTSTSRVRDARKEFLAAIDAINEEVENRKDTSSQDK